MPFGANMAPTWSPKASQNRPKMLPNFIKKEIKMLTIFSVQFYRFLNRTWIDFLANFSSGALVVWCVFSLLLCWLVGLLDRYIGTQPQARWRGLPAGRLDTTCTENALCNNACDAFWTTISSPYRFFEKAWHPAKMGAMKNSGKNETSKEYSGFGGYNSR